MQPYVLRRTTYVTQANVISSKHGPFTSSKMAAAMKGKHSLPRTFSSAPFPRARSYPTETKKENLISDLDIPGVKQMVDTRRGLVGKLLWFCIIFFTFATCLYQISDRFALFLRQPIGSKVSVVRNRTLKFPSITVCPGSDHHVGLMELKQRYAAIHKIKNICDVKSMQLLSMENVTLSSIWEKTDVNNILERSFFGDKSGVNDDASAYSMTITPLNVITGKCSTFSILKPVPFKKEDLRLKLMSHPQPEFGCPANTAVMVMFHEDDEVVHNTFITSAVRVPYGLVLNYGITTREFKVLDTEERPCSTPKVVSKCRNKCIEDVLAKKITCTLPHLINWTMPQCPTFAATVMSLIQNVQLVNNEHILNCSCPRQCHETVYKLTLKDFIDGIDGRGIIEIYFEDNTVDVLTEVYTYSIVAMLCDVGGNLGLFLGLCIPTILDVLESFIMFLVTKISQSFK